MRAFTLSALALVLLVACGSSDRPLHDMRSAGGGPDEFAVIPVRPLQVPPSTALPEPTPGGTNLTDPSPRADAIAALGGSASAQIAGGVPAGDAALVAQSGRYGVDPAVRAQLAAADESFRKRRSRANVFNPLGRDRYFPAYARQALDARQELVRLQSLGIAVPDPTVRRQPVRPQQARPQRVEAQPNEPQPGILQRTLEPLVQGILRGGSEPGGVPQNCVFTTAGPGNELRRVCTPIEADDQ